MMGRRGKRINEYINTFNLSPRDGRLIHNFWHNATMICQVSENQGEPFQAGHSVTQGNPLSTKLFNMLIDAVGREWMWELRGESKLEVEEIDNLMATFFAIFYVDNAYLASQDLEFLQRGLDILIDLFACVGLETNIQKTQMTICTPGRICTQLLTVLYWQMWQGVVTAGEWDSRMVKCQQCHGTMQASSLHQHLADQHQIYQQIVVAEGLLVT
jgi:hypothetical protein